MSGSKEQDQRLGSYFLYIFDLLYIFTVHFFLALRALVRGIAAEHLNAKRFNDMQIRGRLFSRRWSMQTQETLVCSQVRRCERSNQTGNRQEGGRRTG